MEMDRRPSNGPETDTSIGHVNGEPVVVWDLPTEELPEGWEYVGPDQLPSTLLESFEQHKAVPGTVYYVRREGSDEMILHSFRTLDPGIRSRQNGDSGPGITVNLT
jgi:hypothetical protein